MIIQCGSCGFSKSIPHEGTPEEVEQGMADAIEEGWRYVKNYDGYICPACKKNGCPDKLYEFYVGKPKAASKEQSYMALMEDMAWLLKTME